MYLQVCWAAKGKTRGGAFHSYWKNACRSHLLLYSPVLPFPFLETDFGSLSYSFPTVSVLSGPQNTAKLPPLWALTEVWAKVRVPAEALRRAVPCLSETGTSSVLTSVLLFNAKGAELKSTIISEMDKQNRPSWQVWLGATEGRQAAYCPPTRMMSAWRGTAWLKAACEVNLSRHTAESSWVVLFTKHSKSHTSGG